MQSPSLFDLTLNAVVVPGHRVASGLSSDCPYPGGSIRSQIPFFRRLGLDLSAYFPGTLNLDIAPRTFRLRDTDYHFPLVRWTDRVAPETFSFSRCRVVVGAESYDALIYHPNAATKTENYQSPTTIEVLAPLIRGLKYGDAVRLLAQSAQLIVSDSTR